MFAKSRMGNVCDQDSGDVKMDVFLMWICETLYFRASRQSSFIAAAAQTKALRKEIASLRNKNDSLRKELEVQKRANTSF